MAKRKLALKPEDEMVDELSAPHDTGAPTSEPPPAAHDVPPPPPPAPPKPKAVTGSNVVSHATERKEYIRQATELGKEEGAGRVSIIKLARLIVVGAASGVISPSTKTPDVEDIYKAFADRADQASASTRTDDSVRSKSFDVQVSKARAFARLGAAFKDEAESIFDDARDVHYELASKPETAERLRYTSTYAALVLLATTQTNKDNIENRLSRDDMANVMLKPEAEPKAPTDGVDLLINALNMIEAAMRGRAATDNRDERASVSHPDLPVVHDALTRVIDEVGPEKLQARNDEIAAAKAEKESKALKAERDKQAKADAKAKKDAEKAAAKAAGDNPQPPEDEDNEDEFNHLNRADDEGNE